MMETNCLGYTMDLLQYFNNFKTIVPNVNLIKNIGYYNAPTGKGAKKFRNLVTKNILLQ